MVLASPYIVGHRFVPIGFQYARVIYIYVCNFLEMPFANRKKWSLSLNDFFLYNLDKISDNIGNDATWFHFGQVKFFCRSYTLHKLSFAFDCASSSAK